MNATLQCSRCENHFEVSNFNALRIATACPVCGYPEGVAQRLHNQYGATIGKFAYKLFEGLKRVKQNNAATEGATVASTIEFAINKLG